MITDDLGIDWNRLLQLADKREQEAEAKAPADRELARQAWLRDRQEVLRVGGFGRVHLDRCRDEDPGTTLALEGARQFVAGGKAILLLAGGVGCGKTTAGCWVAREVGGARPRRVRATDLERRGRYDREFTGWLDERTMLVLDDLGAEPIDGKGYFAALIDELVDDAWENRRRLVVTTNMGREQLRERLGPRAFSRLTDRAATMAVRCGDEDLRQRGAEPTPIASARAAGGRR